MNALERLDAVLAAGGSWTVAVSGGVDSMTLATLAHRLLPGQVRMVHATSPAVPAAARDLITHHAQIEGWDLRILETGEFSDENYRRNPVNRCYFCKSNLYSGILRDIATQHGGHVASGTNTDDLGDFRPGLVAAENHGIRHPYVEAGIAKADIRALARDAQLDFAELPAQPCLASRIETGIRIDPADLAFVDQLETLLRKDIPASSTLRIRIRPAGVSVETDAPLDGLHDSAARFCAAAGRRFTGVTAYRQGSAFLHEAAS
ncbi:MULTISPECIES: adenine nucleotide alpha hydrolase [unclassified Yoonia]|uniref:adenine nucleotide alpha hydrolase n=1 Tax=unclassified Yoonia TaxID=2629118 RepID=UPI002AFE82F2|nr:MULTISPECIES: adenine nucleotide alpha hydrolase [unclassified Yoonia]